MAVLLPNKTYFSTIDGYSYGTKVIEIDQERDSKMQGSLYGMTEQNQPRYENQSIQRTDSVAELCALELLNSVVEDEEPITSQPSSLDVIEPVMTVSHGALKELFSHPNRQISASQDGYVLEDYDCGFYDAENELIGSTEGSICNQNRTEWQATSQSESFKRSVSLNLLNCMENLKIGESPVRKNTSLTSLPTGPNYDIGQRLFNCVDTSSMNVQPTVSLPGQLPPNQQMRRVISQPVFPSSVPLSIPSFPKKQSSGVLNSGVFSNTWINSDISEGEMLDIFTIRNFLLPQPPSLSTAGSMQLPTDGLLPQFSLPHYNSPQVMAQSYQFPNPVLRTPHMDLFDGYVGDGFLYQVQFKRGIRNFLLAPSIAHSRSIRIGDYVKVEADRGEDLGKVISCVPVSDTGKYATSPVQKGRTGNFEKERILRLATEAELHLVKIKSLDEQRVLEVCRSKVLQRNLPMRVVDAEFQYDRHKLTYYFQAEVRIDFRELVRDLFAIYKTRIWMQQLEGASI